VVVHPWLPQGNVLLMSYTMPFAWSNVSNVVEFVAVSKVPPGRATCR
jgi:hypothetical protein